MPPRASETGKTAGGHVEGRVRRAELDDVLDVTVVAVLRVLVRALEARRRLHAFEAVVLQRLAVLEDEGVVGVLAQIEVRVLRGERRELLWELLTRFEPFHTSIVFVPPAISRTPLGENFSSPVASSMMRSWFELGIVILAFLARRGRRASP